MRSPGSHQILFRTATFLCEIKGHAYSRATKGRVISMRVSNAATEHCNEALFTVVARGPQVGAKPSVVQTYTLQ